MKRLNLTKVVLVLALLIAKQSSFAQDTNSDSLDTSVRNQRKINVPQLLFRGMEISDDSRNRTWFISPLFDIIRYNTVEGLVFNPGVSITQQLKEGKLYALKSNLRYGFGSERLYGKISTIYFYNPSRFGSLTLNGGNFIEQFDEKSTLSPFTNSYSTLFLNENFLKIYESDFLEMGHSFSPIRNIQLNNRVLWSNRAPLQNLEKFNDAIEEYTSNTPVNNEISRTDFDSHQVFNQTTEIRWQKDLKYKYLMGKLVAVSKFPAVILTYKSAHSNFFRTDLSYQRISLGLKGNVHAGQFGNGNFSFEAGDFISKDSLSFVDFTHFQGNRTSYTSYEPGTFQLLDYYALSTSGFYFRGHYNHKFGLIKKVIRLISEGNYLHTSNGNYLELGVGAEKVSSHWRVSFYNSWLDGKHDRAEIRFGFVFPQ